METMKYEGLVTWVNMDEHTIGRIVEAIIRPVGPRYEIALDLRVGVDLYHLVLEADEVDDEFFVKPGSVPKVGARCHLYVCGNRSLLHGTWSEDGREYVWFANLLPV